MTAFRHARSYGGGQADRAVRTLGQVGREDLEDVVPWKMDIRIDRLSSVVAIGIHDEAIIGIHVAATSISASSIKERARNPLTELCRSRGIQIPIRTLELYGR
jgi:repressor of nif and glnA expression